MKGVKDLLVPGLIVISIGLFAAFILGLQANINSRPPGVSYTLGLKKEGDYIRVLAYEIPDSLVSKKEMTKNASGESSKATSTTQAATTNSRQSKRALPNKESHTTTGSSSPIANTNILKEKKLIAFDSVSYGPKMIAVNKNPKLLLWILTFSLMVAVSFALGSGFVSQVVSLAQTFKITGFQWLINSILAAGFFFVLCYANMNSNYERTFLPPLDIIYDLKALFSPDVFSWIYTGEAFAFFVGAVAFFGVLAIHAVISNNAAKPGATNKQGDQQTDTTTNSTKKTNLAKENYIILKTDLDRYLGGFSVLVVFSVLTISFLNQALIAHFVNIEELQVIRSEFIYAYGFVFSSLLALIYIPTNQRLRLSSEPGAIDDNTKEKNTFFNSFTTLLSIVAPLLSSGVAEMIKAFSQ